MPRRNPASLRPREHRRGRPWVRYRDVPGLPGAAKAAIRVLERERLSRGIVSAGGDGGSGRASSPVPAGETAGPGTRGRRLSTRCLRRPPPNVARGVERLDAVLLGRTRHVAAGRSEFGMVPPQMRSRNGAGLRTRGSREADGRRSRPHGRTHPVRTLRGDAHPRQMRNSCVIATRARAAALGVRPDGAARENGQSRFASSMVSVATSSASARAGRGSRATPRPLRT